MLIAIIAGLEAMLVFAARSKQGRARRQQLLMGTSTDLNRAAVPLVDDYLKQKTARATRFQRFIARKLAALCRRVVHTRSFEYVLLNLVRTTINKRRNQLLKMKRGITL